MNKGEMLQALGKQQPESSKPGRGGDEGDSPKPEGTGPEDWKNVPGNQT